MRPIHAILAKAQAEIQVAKALETAAATLRYHASEHQKRAESLLDQADRLINDKTENTPTEADILAERAQIGPVS